MRRLTLLLFAVFFAVPAFAQTYSFSYTLQQANFGSPKGALMAGYVAGDQITLQCDAVMFSIPPIILVTGASGGIVTSFTLNNSPLTTGTVPDAPPNCTQYSTTGAGSGFWVTLNGWTL